MFEWFREHWGGVKVIEAIELVWKSQVHKGFLVQHFVTISFTNTPLHFKMIWLSENVFQKYSALVQDDQVFENVF